MPISTAIVCHALISFRGTGFVSGGTVGWRRRQGNPLGVVVAALFGLGRPGVVDRLAPASVILPIDPPEAGP